jgi:pSer/pThr/pTyr-binding forkhead associated (FHA) protein
VAKLLGWEVTVTIDPALKVEGSPEPPENFEAVVAALRAGSNLIGRTSPRRGIHPEVSLDQDDAVSHRHALLEVHADGTLTLRDIGSSNGTSVNGKEIKQLEDVALNDADQITLGHWTRLLIKAVR